MSFSFTFNKPADKNATTTKSALKRSDAKNTANDVNTSTFSGPTQISPAERLLVLKEEGNILAEAGRFVRALAKWDEALQIDPQNSVLHELRAQVLMEMEEYDAALEAATQATNFDPEWSDAHFTLGRVCFNLGLLDQAHASMSHALRLAIRHEDPTGAQKSGSTSASQIEDELDDVAHLMELKQRREDAQAQSTASEHSTHGT